VALADLSSGAEVFERFLAATPHRGSRPTTLGNRIHRSVGGNSSVTDVAGDVDRATESTIGSSCDAPRRAAPHRRRGRLSSQPPLSNVTLTGVDRRRRAGCNPSLNVDGSAAAGQSAYIRNLEIGGLESARLPADGLKDRPGTPAAQIRPLCATERTKRPTRSGDFRAGRSVASGGQTRARATGGAPVGGSDCPRRIPPQQTAFGRALTATVGLARAFTGLGVGAIPSAGPAMGRSGKRHRADGRPPLRMRAMRRGARHQRGRGAHRRVPRRQRSTNHTGGEGQRSGSSPLRGSRPAA
jgi:hypothetical protein